ncbi:hypothetical protein VP01_1192g4 [Puccinia sorghi]|uniref:Monopolin complex subunit Csm1/Pcs1 C-terminal domain-containing protein n=1 Tax=Puccinia sorghi TaxID=27349 RepID=A0A0L6VS90_9BASI|nr:hypothetical protein VP01_1192g4 [Puccinia sorghi]
MKRLNSIKTNSLRSSSISSTCHTCLQTETKDQLLKELQSIRQTDAEQLLEQHKQVAETRYAGKRQGNTTKKRREMACLKLSNTREEAMKEYKQKVMDLNAKLSRVYSGEEERDRQRLEEEKEALVQENQRLKAAHDTQRKRRKEAERVAQQAHAMAEEAVQEQLQEANDEGKPLTFYPKKKKKTESTKCLIITVKTLKKMLATETENSKAMIVQLNHLRTNASSSTSGHHSNNSHTNQQNSGPNNTGMEKTIEDLKQRLSVIGDFTGLEILSSTPDKRGVIYDCIFGDIVHRGLALHFKLQFHPDGTCSYTPSLDPDRDSPTIKIIPDFLQTFVRFDLKACGHVYWKLFQAFNLQDT